MWYHTKLKNEWRPLNRTLRPFMLYMALFLMPLYMEHLTHIVALRISILLCFCRYFYSIMNHESNYLMSSPEYSISSLVFLISLIHNHGTCFRISGAAVVLLTDFPFPSESSPRSSLAAATAHVQPTGWGIEREHLADSQHPHLVVAATFVS